MTASRKVALGAAVAGAGLLVGTAVAVAAPSAAHGRVVLADSVAAAVAHARPVGSVPAARRAHVQLWLTPRTAAAARRATAVSTPGSTQFHHYLTPAQYTARFGPSAASARRVAGWLRGQGYSRVSVDAQRNYVSADGTTRTVEASLHVQLRRYRVRSGAHTETVVANDRAVSLPAAIAGDVTGLTGLDNVRPVTPHTTDDPQRASATSTTCSSYWGQHVKKDLPSFGGSTSEPYIGCGYSGAQLRAAYGMTSSADGAGQTIAYIEVGLPYRMEKLLGLWAARNGLPAPDPAHYSQLKIGSGNKCFNDFDVEEQLDVEAGYAMAPGANQLLVGGDSCDLRRYGLQALFDADLRVVDGDGSAPVASIASNSWGASGGETLPGDIVNVEHSILTRAAVEGVGMYFSTGDGPGVSFPSDDPFATAVGGTSLGIGKSDNRLFETGWSNDVLVVTKKHTLSAQGVSLAGGGGTSLLWKEPSYQQGVVPTSMTTPVGGDTSGLRALPDISADGDLGTGIREGYLEHTRKGDRYTSFAQGGTSLAAPLVTGMIADAQQGRSTPFGFANPAIYSLSGTNALNDPLAVTSATPASQRAFFCPTRNEECGAALLITLDSAIPAYTDQVTRSGYDTMTGVGTPNGQAFIAALRQAGS